MARSLKKRAKKWLKQKLKHSQGAHYILSHIAALAMRFIYLSCRVSRDYPASLAPYDKGQKRAIFIFWHGRMIMMPFLKPRGEFVVLISHHNDGSLITTTMERFGIGAVRGSKSQGSSEAVRGLVDAAERGANMAITPDGPRGPFQVAAPGAIYVAMRTGYPIIPVGFSATRHWRLGSWDKFMIPKPFSRIRFVAGDMIHVPAELDADALKAATLNLAERLSAATATADIHCGVQP